MIRKIVGVRNQKLREPSKKVVKVDKRVLGLVRDLKDTLLIQKDPEGVGLAAPQIGKNLRLFAMRHEGKVKVVINPKIVEISKEKINAKESEIMEGCLSLPHYYGPLERAKKITIKYQTTGGIKKTESFEGFPAQIVQHEIDHLDGKIFVDEIIRQKLSLYKQEGDDWIEVELT